MSIAILLPALGSARDAAREMQTLAQLRNIAMANFAYAADNAGKYADDLAKLDEYIGDPETLISPRSIRDAELPANFADLPQAQQDTLIRQHSSFVLVPLGNQDKAQGGEVMLFERPDDTDDFDLVVAFADGSAMRLPQDELEQLLQKQTGQTLKQLTQRQENFGK